MKVKIKKLHSDAVLPKYAKPGDAGQDLVATSVRFVDEYVEYGTGLAFEIPEGYVGCLVPRSSISKKDLLLSNSFGVLDSGYRGEVTFRFKRCLSNNLMPALYEAGDRIGQIIILPFPQIEFEESDELSDSERGTGGYGSTGV